MNISVFCNKILWLHGTLLLFFLTQGLSYWNKLDVHVALHPTTDSSICLRRNMTSKAIKWSSFSFILSIQQQKFLAQTLHLDHPDNSYLSNPVFHFSCSMLNLSILLAFLTFSSHEFYNLNYAHYENTLPFDYFKTSPVIPTAEGISNTDATFFKIFIFPQIFLQTQSSFYFQFFRQAWSVIHVNV